MIKKRKCELFKLEFNLNDEFDFYRVTYSAIELKDNTEFPIIYHEYFYLPIGLDESIVNENFKIAKEKIMERIIKDFGYYNGMIKREKT
ncbi:hypothetical protein LI063_03485 [Clostridium perfringens]|uniref:hypothetical protein n=1 Tax=Clostridium perfringens TaxID=1502 RepID=UPI0022456DB7|nr:hypothetical protein [Clostridium perfringens]MCX0363226.1 hypothetical protein [Clostridium perfringens]